MTTTLPAATVPPGLPPRLAGDWATLTHPTTTLGHFDEDLVSGLPEPARRWLRHAIAPGTPISHAAVIGQHGEIRAGSWRPFRATEALAPLDGFIWSVSTRLFGAPVRGFDRRTGGCGEMRHRLFGTIGLMSAHGPDVTRSAAARQAAEIAWVPGAALAPAVHWLAVDDQRVTVLIPCGDEVCAPTLTIAPSGALTAITVSRWTGAGGQGWHEEPFTALFPGEATFGGYRIPGRSIAGWGYGTDRWRDGVFIRQVIDSATFF